MRALGKRVRLLRRTAELTQDELAAAAGLSRSFVSLIEHGARGVDVVRLLRIAAVLGLPLHELVNLGVTGADRVKGLPS
jgi:transcriptional regulator with XRE-family HTH domain